MKTSCLLSIAVAALASTASGFSITNCDNGDHHNFGEKGNGECHDWDGGHHYSYDSNKGCTLTVYDQVNCVGRVVAQTMQNVCLPTDFYIRSVRCG